MKLKDDRSFLLTILFTILTLGIYSLYLTHVFARDTNVACEGDNRHTMGLVACIFLGLITFGIFNIVWSCLVISRWENYLYANGTDARLSVGSYLLWSILGSFIIVGPFIASYKFLHCFNDVCGVYNSKLDFAGNNPAAVNS